MMSNLTRNSKRRLGIEENWMTSVYHKHSQRPVQFLRTLAQSRHEELARTTQYFLGISCCDNTHTTPLYPSNTTTTTTTTTHGIYQVSDITNAQTAAHSLPERENKQIKKSWHRFFFLEWRNESKREQERLIKSLGLFRILCCLFSVFYPSDVLSMLGC